MALSKEAFKKQIKDLYKEGALFFNKAQSVSKLYELKVKYMGKKGKLSLLLRNLIQISKEDRPRIGKLLNKVKEDFEVVYNTKKAELDKKEIQSQILNEKIDLTLPGPFRSKGAYHPTRMVVRECVEIFSQIGFSVELGPLIEKDFYNFEALNIPKDHPSRDLQDTFYIDKEHVLRTHTSPVQIHVLRKLTPPLRVLAPGPVFRRDNDVSHSPNFYQIEGLLVEKKASLSDLKGSISFFIKRFLHSRTKIRFRPSFFPFTEPSAEVDCSCPLCRLSPGENKQKTTHCSMCKNTGWVEVGGCGLVHPNVFRKVGLEAKAWEGFAFGFGIERLAIIKYGISDIRLFSENDIEFLGQF